MTQDPTSHLDPTLLSKVKLICAYHLIGAPPKLDFESLSHPKTPDFLWLKDNPHPKSVSLQRRVAYQIVCLTHELLNDGCDVEPLIDFIVDPDPAHVQALTRYYQVSCTLTEAIHLISAEYFWFYIKDHSETLFYDVDRVVWLLTGCLEYLEYLEYIGDVTDRERMRAHPLNTMFPSFLRFVEAALNTHCDNTGFVEAHDDALREGALAFAAELTDSSLIMDRLSRPRPH